MAGTSTQVAVRTEGLGTSLDELGVGMLPERASRRNRGHRAAADLGQCLTQSVEL